MAQSTTQHAAIFGKCSTLQCNPTPDGGCIVKPTTSSQVSEFLQAVSPLVLGGKLKFTIRDGGTQLAPDGQQFPSEVLVLDLGEMKGVQIGIDDTITVAAGEKWASVNQKLDTHGISVAGGLNGGRGIGRLALQGGLSLFSSSQGFVADNVANYEIVLPSGKTINASPSEHVDLWRSLKGGSNNYGIQALVDLLHSPTEGRELRIILSTLFSAQFGGIVSLNRVYHTTGREDAPETQPFTRVGPRVGNLTSLGHVTVSNATADPKDVVGSQRRAHIDMTVKADVVTLQAATDIFMWTLDPIKGLDDSRFVASILFETLSTSLIKGSSESRNLFGLDPSAGPLISLSFVIKWTSKKDDKAILDHFHKVMENIKKYAVSRGTAIPLAHTGVFRKGIATTFSLFP
ncbi:FAD-binding domain-containing protein [Xylaria bambusicola]|uniref:FAD-binding domain-containing protein n=1 Tax=Xylaria bambusicola TaxID=326684 RepID=UPI0020087A56|nr:FAD-binding domain-containing protein [Xylaria bambusicola]KAI0506872.1 FAD-binding domain-containing protein [Xylaria bambusicola]